MSTYLWWLIESIFLNYVVDHHFYITHYHDCCRYMVAGPIDLWNTFDYVLYDADYVIEDGFTINKYMDSWTKQPGYPLITVTSTGEGGYKVSQVMKKKIVLKLYSMYFYVWHAPVVVL